MGFATVVFKEYTGRTVQLRHNHALGTVNHKRTTGGHQRNFAHIHFVFAYFFNHFGRSSRIFIVNFQTDTRTQRGCVGNTAQLALRNIKQRLAQNIMDKIQLGIAVVAQNRKNRGKRSLQPFFVFALIKRAVLLQEFTVRFQLRGQQIRHIQYGIALGKTLTDAFFLGKGVTHGQYS